MVLAAGDQQQRCGRIAVGVHRHSLTIDHGWAEIADATLTWLAAQGL
ncbi:hypothetical protein ACFXG4_22035 [Nocardia sp. NPDC059246]